MSAMNAFKSSTPRLQFFTGNTTHMVFEDELAVKFNAKDVEEWEDYSENGNPRQSQVNTGRVLSPGAANNYSLCFVL